MKYLVQAFYPSIIIYCKRKYCTQNILCVAYHACWPTDTRVHRLYGPADY